ncbi:MAG: hypothetical protein LHV69_07050 [Elusimicrobia bacterium]|nr:hypothetical protein [Candidatus Obscuribacterium magneticum]
MKVIANEANRHSAKAGIQHVNTGMDSRFRGNDVKSFARRGGLAMTVSLAA